MSGHASLTLTLFTQSGKSVQLHSQKHCYNSQTPYETFRNYHYSYYYNDRMVDHPVTVVPLLYSNRIVALVHHNTRMISQLTF